MTDAEYRHDFRRCPYCHGHHIWKEFTRWDDHQVVVQMKCTDCQCDWWARFTLRGWTKREPKEVVTLYDGTAETRFPWK